MRMRKYLRFRFSNSAKKDSIDHEGGIIAYMSPGLRKEAVLYMSSAWLRKVEVFGKVSEDAISEIASSMTSMSYGPFEFIFRINHESSSMLIIEKGVVGCRGLLRCPGDLVGEECILAGSDKKNVRRRGACVITPTK